MKNSQRCPKCQGTDILRIPGKVGVEGFGQNIITFGWSHVKVTRYLCAACGFSEEWIDAAADIAKLTRKFKPASV